MKGVGNVKNKFTQIYAKLSPERNEAVFSGIKFVDFIECVPIPIENILLSKPVGTGNRYFRCFELLEGECDISKLKLQNIYSYGDFCFVDYANLELVNQLTEEQIAELLYLMHMHKPLKSPFFSPLQNNYVYLSHDDGWYCKLYCKEQQDLTSVLFNKILKIANEVCCNTVTSLPHDLSEKITELSTLGMLIQLNLPQKSKAIKKHHNITVRLYAVGEHENMDDLFNNLDGIESQLSFEMQI